MPDSGANFNLDFNNNKISGELDENGELTYFEAKIKAFQAKFKKKLSKKEMDKLRFEITGIPQLATVSPNPLDREDIIEKEFSAKAITLKPWFTFIVTIAAIIFDFFCYLLMFEEEVGTESDFNIISIFASIAAAAAIDILPAFFARIINTITNKQKLVLRIFLIISIIFVCFFLLVCLGVRCNYFTSNYSEFGLTDEAFVQFLIPIATTLICFIVNYLAYNPYEKHLKTLRKIKLYREENINELKAAIIEIDNEPDYLNRLINQDDCLYNAAQKRIEAIGKHYRTYVRNIIMISQSSPADTSDLSV